MTLRYGPTSPLPRGAERADHPVAQLVHPFRQLKEVMLADAWTVRGLTLRSWSMRRPCSETPPLLRPPLLIASAPGWGSRSRRTPREPLDAPDDLRKQALSQPAFGQLEDEVPGMSDEASPGLE